MKAFLLYKNRDFDIKKDLPLNDETLVQDLELDTLFSAMSQGDKFIHEVSHKVILSGIENNIETILYRQNILKDCLKNASIIFDLYKIAVEAIEKEKKIYWGIFSKYPQAILGRSIDVLLMFVSLLKLIRKVADQQSDKFESEGFRIFFSMIQNELGDDYFKTIQYHLKELKFKKGVLISAQLGRGNKGINYVLRKPYERPENWIERIKGKTPPAYTIKIDLQDDNGAKYLSDIRDRGINLVANALAQSTEHILNFFSMLRIELAFYIGCVNLNNQMIEKKEPICFPQPLPHTERKHSVKGIYDICLALSMQQNVIGNDLEADKKTS
jgi:DNA mismatch repair ATPase MutS